MAYSMTQILLLFGRVLLHKTYIRKQTTVLWVSPFSMFWDLTSRCAVFQLSLWTLSVFLQHSESVFQVTSITLPELPKQREARTSSYFMDTNTEPWKKDSQEETDKTGKNKQTTVVSNTLTGFGWNHFHQHFQELSGICYDIWPFVPWWLLGNKQLGVMKWKHLQSYTFRGFLIFWIS